MAVEISRQAFDYAKEAGIDRIASEGAGSGFMNRFVAAKAAMLRPQMARARADVGAETMSRLGEGTQSGQYGTARGAVEAYGFGQFAQAISDSVAANEDIRSNAQGQWMNVLMDVDQRTQQAEEFQRQLDANESSTFDRVLGLASVFLPHAGGIKKIIKGS